MSDAIDGEALKAALLGNQVNGENPHVSRERLKKLINSNRWATIGRMFGFEPKFMVVGGSSVFDWNSCNQGFWKVYNVPPEPAPVMPMVSSRSEWAFQNEQKKRKKGSRVNKQRNTLWEKQEGKCWYCFQPCTPKTFTIDHIVPKSRGGGNNILNKVGACSSCNNAKGSMSQEEFLKSNYLENKIKWINACKRNAEKIEKEKASQSSGEAPPPAAVAA